MNLNANVGGGGVSRAACDFTNTQLLHFYSSGIGVCVCVVCFCFVSILSCWKLLYYCVPSTY